MTCVILTTDTLHHRYFVNRIARTTRPVVVLEERVTSQWKSYWRAVRRSRSIASLVDNPYLYRRYRRFNRLQNEFERDKFFRDMPADFSGAAEIITTDNVNSASCLQLLDSLRASLVVSFGTGRIGGALLDRSEITVNVHRGVLPTYRGLDSDLWACFFRDFSNIGTCIHVVDRSLDTGPIVEQRRLHLAAHMKAHQLRYHTTLLAAEMVERIIAVLSTGGRLASTPQHERHGKYYSYIPPIRRTLAMQRFNRHVASLTASAKSAVGARHLQP